MIGEKYAVNVRTGRLGFGILFLIFQMMVGGCLAQTGKTTGYVISPGKSSVTIPFELEDNRIFVDVKLNGKGPFHFILDSGAGNAITPEVARLLGLKLENPFQVSGVGENTEQGWRTAIDSIELGDIKGSNQAFSVFSLDTIKNAIGFRKFDGLIGFELFSSFVAKIDYQNSNVSFTDPGEFSYTGKGVVIPSEFSGHIPRIDAELDGFRGKFIIDTGDRSSLTLFVPFIEKNKLRDKYAPKIEVVTGWGIGGPVKAQVIRTGTLKLDEFAVKDPVTRLPLLKSGGFTENAAIGSIGTGVLKRFNIIFDYRRSRLILEKNANFSTRDDYDGAGMWLSQKGEIFAVTDIAAAGPAAGAGIRTGDEIISINGIKSESLSLPQVRTMLKYRPENTSDVKLTVQTGTARKEISLTLKEII